MAIPASTPGVARVVGDKPGAVTIDTRAAGPQLLVTTESFDSGWTVAIDKRPATICGSTEISWGVRSKRVITGRICLLSTARQLGGRWPSLG